MSSTPPPGRLLALWLLWSFVGWLLGIVLAVVLAVGADSLGVEGAQTMIGIGAGAGVGLLQGRVLRPWLGTVRPWLVATVLGLGLPFLVSDVLSAVGVPVFSLPLCVAAGGLLTGWLQMRRLRPHVERAVWWVPVSLLAWSAAGATVTLGDVLKDDLPRGVAGLVCVLALWLSGGVVLGVVEGLTLRGLRLARPAR